MEIKNFNTIKKAASIFRKIIQILFWVFLVLGVVLIFIEAIVVMIPEKYFMLSDFYKGDLTFGIGGLFEYDFATRLGEELIFKPVLLVLIPTLILNLIFYSINFRQVQSILKTVIVDRPFSEKNAHSFFVMSMAFIVGSFILRAATNLVFIKIVSMFGVGGINFDFTPNFTMLFTGILLIILNGVFRYGNYLQEEFDSTI